MLLLMLVGVGAGIFGAMMGLGGGIILIPALTGLLGVPMRTAIGVSVVCVVATSCGASISYLQKNLTHSRLAMTLETATVAGALTGGLIAMWINPLWLTVIFGCVLLYVFYNMYCFSAEDGHVKPTGMLDTEYLDPVSKKTISYGVRRLRTGLGLSLIAGSLSGLLGIGGGIVKIPVMNLVMGVPLRAAIATSNFMIGITAATSALVYFAHGHIDPKLAAPTALGILAGARLGVYISNRTKSNLIKQMFQVVLLIFSIQMFYQAFRGGG